MHIRVNGVLNYRQFHFAGDFFGWWAFTKIISTVGDRQSDNRFCGDLTATARQLAKEIISLGGVKKVVLFEVGFIDVWTYEPKLWTTELKVRIKELIEKYYGPKAPKVFNLPFGLTLIAPRR